MATSRSTLLHHVKRFAMRTRRRLYACRAFVPGLRERHRLEAMVGPLGFWNELQKYHLQVLRDNGLQPQHALLDIGCGPLQGGIAFIRYLEPGAYAGIDIDPERIKAAQQQIDRHQLGEKRPRVFVSTTFGGNELGAATFDFMWASQILYYFNDATMSQLLSMIKRRLNPGGKFLGDIFSPDHYEFKHPEHPGRYVRHTAESLAAQASGHGLTVRSLGVIGDFGYPRRLSLRSNPLFELSHASSF